MFPSQIELIHGLTIALIATVIEVIVIALIVQKLLDRRDGRLLAGIRRRVASRIAHDSQKLADNIETLGGNSIHYVRGQHDWLSGIENSDNLSVSSQQSLARDALLTIVGIANAAGEMAARLDRVRESYAHVFDHKITYCFDKVVGTLEDLKSIPATRPGNYASDEEHLPAARESITLLIELIHTLNTDINDLLLRLGGQRYRNAGRKGFSIRADHLALFDRISRALNRTAVPVE